MIIKSFIQNNWVSGHESTHVIKSPIDEKTVGLIKSLPLSFDDVIKFSREVGGTELRAMSLSERAKVIKQLAKYLLDKKASLYEYSTLSGATKKDSWLDIDGGIGVMFSLSSSALNIKEFGGVIIEDDCMSLNADSSFFGRHILSPKEGVSIHISAFNFPVWGILEKITPSLLAGVPVIIKPASVTSYVTEELVKLIIDSKLLPVGAIQMVCGDTGDLLEQLVEQDVVTFTGSAHTSFLIRSKLDFLRKNIPLNVETDSLNSIVLSKDVKPGDSQFVAFCKEVANEITLKAGQRCTAIRRVFVPSFYAREALELLQNLLRSVVIGNPLKSDVEMGPLISIKQKIAVQESVNLLSIGNEVFLGDLDDFETNDINADSSTYFPPTIIFCKDPHHSNVVHQEEAFGPVCTLMPYNSYEEVASLVQKGKGSLVCSIFCKSSETISNFFKNITPYHGRILVQTPQSVKTSTGHGSALPNLVHGGPGRAGGGQELGGNRALKFYMQRTAIQSDMHTIKTLTGIT